MKRLLTAELRRAAARGITKGALLLTLLVALFALFGTYRQVATMPSEAQMQQDFKAVHDDWVKNHVQNEKTCRETTPKDVVEANPGMCEMQEPTKESWFGQRLTIGQQARDVRMGLSLIVALAALMLGASLVCAEFTSGSMMTWLTFEPRRSRVYATKVIAAALFGLLPALVVFLVDVPGLWLIGQSGGLQFGPGEQSTYFASFLRLFGVGAFAGLVGAALGFVARHTTAVLGAAIVYLIAFEIILASSIESMKRWTIGTAVTAFVEHGHGWTTYPDCYGPQECKPIEHWLGFWPATAQLAVVATVITLGGLAIFRRRDVG
ncbi:ABC transporter permease subunit [Yimella sp. cx-51]|uniref:ABC transporter permease subunit n=1 Tax=Yimella sp. cx-51 TaxID=2770551 RepID=UPI00165E1E50|nr:ABC transporter permease subunit [Yimella sp. cx-51]MBC9956657.1 ABC transporter permease [Yimella sp. cx-51]MBD2759084.1 ABC transporter permease [Yimella sp. cx-573]QTH38898.1 ABC transporter permease [Yimella sp. cx-51]